MTSGARPSAEGAVERVLVVLPDDVTSARDARAVVRDTLHGWGLPELVEDAQLAVSELVTNAQRHGLPPVTLGLQRLSWSLRIDVSDMRPSTAYRDLVLTSEDDDESGRGRGIIEAVADRTGLDTSVETGKRVYVAWDTDAQA